MPRRAHVLAALPASPGTPRLGGPAPVLEARGGARLPRGRDRRPVRRLGGARPPGSRVQRLLHDPEAPYVWCPGRGAEGRVLRGDRERRQGLPDRVGQGGRSSSTRPSSRSTPSPSAPTGASTWAPRPTARSTRSTPRARPRPSSIPRRSTSGPWPSIARATSSWPRAAEGKVYRVDAKGKAETLLDERGDPHPLPGRGREGEHLRGQRAGGHPLPHRPSRKVFVLHDSPYREVKRWPWAPTAASTRRSSTARGKTSASRPAGAGASGRDRRSARSRGHGHRDLRLAPPPAPPAQPRPAPSRPDGSRQGRRAPGLPSGEVDTLWSSATRPPRARARGRRRAGGAPGNKGKLYRVRDDRTWDMSAAFPAEQITALVPRDRTGRVVLATSNPGKRLRPRRRRRAPAARSSPR